MARIPFSYLEKQWAGSYQSNQLIESATQTSDRKQVQLLDFDTPRNVSVLGRRTLLSMGRWLYANSSFVRGALDEQVRLALSSFEAQFVGEDKEWGKTTKQWMEDDDALVEIRGGVWTMDMVRRQIGLSLLMDGEIGIILTQDRFKNGRVQLIPAHRIGARLTETTVVDIGSPYNGMRIIDGVIVDDYAIPQAYRVYGENPSVYTTYEDISVNDMILAYIPDFSDQLRGYSRIAWSFFECEDVREARLFELIAGKIAASYAVVEHTDTGLTDKTKKVVAAGATAADATTGASASIPTKLVQPGTILTVKANSGQKLEIPNSDRPSVNMMNFQDTIIDSVMAGTGWSRQILMGAALNGGALRIAVEKVNAKSEELRTLGVGPVIKRVNNFRIAKAAKNGRIESNKDFWRWRYHGPAELTPDKKYDSQVAISEMAAGITSPQRVCAKNNAVFEEVAQESVDAALTIQTMMEKQGVKTLIGSAQVDKSAPKPEGDEEEKPEKKKKDKGE